MSKVTSKLQVSVPKALAERYGIAPGDDLQWQAAGDVLRVVPPGRQAQPRSLRERLRLFDEATSRQQRRDAANRATSRTERGWTRDDLYDRGDGAR